MPLSTQVKLLQLLEERIYSRVGGADTLTADVRFIAATNRDLQQMVAAGQFREDLFFRLQQFIVELPPLRERIDDIEVLAHWFIERYAAHLDRPAPALRAGALERLQGYEWPGNVRELEFVLQRAVLLCSGGIESEDLTLAEAPDGVGRSGLATLAEMERQHIRRALEMTDGVVFGDRGAALLLGMNPHTLRSRIKKLGLRDED
jgi:transcriptional regulator with GAF, ATPase, and Fis domain